MFVFVVFCVGSGRCDELITRSEESYRVCVCLCVCVCVCVLLCVCVCVLLCVCVCPVVCCDLETSTWRRPSPELGCSF